MLYEVITIIEVDSEIKIANAVIDSEGQVEMQTPNFHKLILKIDGNVYEQEINENGDYSEIVRIETLSDGTVITSYSIHYTKLYEVADPLTQSLSQLKELAVALKLN